MKFKRGNPSRIFWASLLIWSLRISVPLLLLGILGTGSEVFFAAPKNFNIRLLEFTCLRKKCKARNQNIKNQTGWKPNNHACKSGKRKAKTSRPTSETSSKELNLICKLNLSWTWSGPDLSPLPSPVGCVLWSPQTLPGPEIYNFRQLEICIKG